MRFFRSINNSELETLMPFTPSREAFDHVAFVTSERPPNAVRVEENKVWISSPREHPFNIEFMFYDADSPAPEAVRTKPHVAYRTTDLEEAMRGYKVVQPPFDPSGVGFVKVAFIEAEGVLIELMEYRDPDETGWFT
ncbi:hypothetical protein [Sphingomonas paucimobilis]|uniref:hypothetical protein n=2 Tax=Alphaproteobacteria TaxID=28211 RepID=UPI002434D595|nr:hypothetical protein [Sphingomonas paucimobilis]